MAIAEYGPAVTTLFRPPLLAGLHQYISYKYSDNLNSRKAILVCMFLVQHSDFLSTVGPSSFPGEFSSHSDRMYTSVSSRCVCFTDSLGAISPNISHDFYSLFDGPRRSTIRAVSLSRCTVRQHKRQRTQRLAASNHVLLSRNVHSSTLSQ
jgi:hypothetical protein